MRRILLQRLLLSVPLVIGVSMVTFVMAGLTPGNAAQSILGTNASSSSIAALERRLGLNQPIYQQYADWVRHLFQGSLGRSLFSGEPVTRILNDALPITVTLIVATVAVALLLGIALGVSSARRSGTGGQVVDALSLLGFALPAFWLGQLLVLGFSTKLHLLPPSGWTSPGTSVGAWLESIVLPVATLGVGGAALVAKQMRAAMLEVMEQEYIRALRARGISERSITYRHAVRNALPNVITLLGLYVVYLLLATTLVESVFALQGLGSIAVQATTQHDLPVLEGAALYFTIIVVVTFAIVDVVRAWLSPKLRTAR